MRILKITLQNINSLKSDTPLEIDFQEERFIDVGLFAITGDTGAGKSTILDAITIALYQRVPRFQGAKGGRLEDVVSYGATDALARILFQSGEEIFEAQWSIRVASKGGKALTTPKEEMRLKSLTNGNILAEKKREMQPAVERVTGLTYQQFLRSVMLSQGDFAAFLTAKASEKSELLEQITGEEVYKKIGGVVGDRVSEEKRTLDLLRLKVDGYKVLSSDDILNLNGEKRALDIENQNLEKGLSLIEGQKHIFEKQNHLTKEESSNRTAQDELRAERLGKQSSLDLLTQYEMVEPLREHIVQRESLNINLKTRDQYYSNLLKEGQKLKDKEIELSDKFKRSFKLLQAEERELKVWQPKINRVVELDANIHSIREDVVQRKSLLNNLKREIKESRVTKLDLDKQRSTLNREKQDIVLLLERLQQYSGIEEHIEEWNRLLIAREQGEQTIGELKKKIEVISQKIARDEEIYRAVVTKSDENRAKRESIEAEVTVTKERLGAINLKDIHKFHTDLISRRGVLDSIISLQEQLKEAEKRANIIKVEAAESSKEREVLEERVAKGKIAIDTVRREKLNLERAVKDAETIVKMTRTIKELDHYRSELEAGGACPLCGSTNHPSIAEYRAKDLSESEILVESRKTNLVAIQDKEKQYELAVKGFETKIASLKEGDKRFVTEQKDLQIHIKNLKGEESRLIVSDKSIVDAMAIEQPHLTGYPYVTDYSVESCYTLKELLSEWDGATLKEIKVVEELMSSIESAQKRVKELDDIYAKSREEQIKIKELINSGTKQREESTIEETRVKKEHQDIEETLTVEFNKRGLKLPIVKETGEFQQELKSNIKRLKEGSNRILQIDIANSSLGETLVIVDRQIADRESDSISKSEALGKIEKGLVSLESERETILPLRLTPNEKQQILGEQRDKAKREFDVVEAEKKRVANLIIVQGTTEIKELQEIEELKRTLVSVEGNIEKHIAADSNLSHLSLSELHNLLLPLDRVQELRAIRTALTERNTQLLEEKKRIEREQVDIKGKIEEIGVSLESLGERQIALQKSRDSSLMRIGEIDKLLELDRDKRSEQKELFVDVDKQTAVLNRWVKLHNVLGGSRDAFNKYVQRLTLNNLINLANVHLFKLHGRFSIKMDENYRKSDELALSLVDHYQSDMERPIDTCSGGEKFLISLSLALGLSDLSSNKVTIGSLFIDEGFGTLDKSSLEMVISTLESLHMQGKMIGIISHVDSLKERIGTRIEIQKRSQGVSTISII